MFEKVSYSQYKSAWEDLGMVFSAQDEETLLVEWEKIKVPARATAGSAGYDFYLPRTMDFSPRRNQFFPTGIRCVMDEIDMNVFLSLVPKSGLGCKYGMRLLNTMGVVDKDYAHSDNEGHIMCGISVERELHLHAGDKFLQGILQMFFTFHGEKSPTAVRDGGFGSTGRN